MFYAKSTRTVISGQGESERYAMYKKKRAVMSSSANERAREREREVVVVVERDLRSWIEEKQKS